MTINIHLTSGMDIMNCRACLLAYEMPCFFWRFTVTSIGAFWVVLYLYNTVIFSKDLAIHHLHVWEDLSCLKEQYHQK
ncbi:hypothetical protein XELAEV_18027424mg [Xenopus laevis]|uniref:Uncharacterized protein n=1 Tax=Xenopus laevis TaxID=8355 RepID=A0A974CVF1_XENLA|nr:hypothetical protein XELAEV_18027424mg [Xenopus laevis]